MIVIALGGNLPLPDGRGPLAGCLAALAALQAEGVGVPAVSRWYATAPVPASDQPWFVNACAQADTALEPAALLAKLHVIEAQLGRVRTVRNAARPIDLDIVLYGDWVQAGDGAGEPALPHPRMAERKFVLAPLADLVPADWRHPVTGQDITALRAGEPADQQAQLLAEQPGVPPPGRIDTPGGTG